MKSKKMFVLMMVVLFVVIPSSSAFGGYILYWGIDYWDDNNPSVDPYQPDGNDFVDIAAGLYHSLALKEDGSIVAWIVAGPGNSYGQCDVDVSESNDFVANDFVAIEAGTEHSLALRSDGSLVAWGNNYHGQRDVPPGNDFVDIAAGNVHNLALKEDGSVVAWGYGSNDPCQPDGNDFVDIAAGLAFSIVLKSDGSLAAWGRNIYDQCNVPEGNDFIRVAAGMRHGLALKSDGSLVAWGRNLEGQCNVPDGNDGNDFVDITGGWYHSLALKSDGSLVAWGRNLNGQCNVPDGNDFVAIAANSDFSLALTSDRTVTLTIYTKPNGMNNVIPGIGKHSCYPWQRVYINAPRCPNCPDVYKFDHWTGDITDPNSPSAYLIMDRDKTITAVYTADVRWCGDECHRLLEGDLNKDCRVNFSDFVIYSEIWLFCTAPECDKDYDEYIIRISQQ